MAERPSFACAECGESVSSLSYRSNCPSCGGHLEHTLHS